MDFFHSQRLSRGEFLLLLLAVLAVGPSMAGFSAEKVRPLNVVFFLVDDLGAMDIGCNNPDTFYETPNIDRLAKEGVRFTDAYAACHVCSPTRAGILTGKSPARLGLTDWLPGRKDFPFQKLKNVATRPHLSLEETTLAEAFKEHGYATGHFGKWHLGEEPFGPPKQGFDVQVPRWNKGWPNAGYHAPFALDGLLDAPGEYLTDRLTDEAIKFIEANREQPFFLYLSHFAVHDPIQGKRELVEKYAAKLNSQPRPKGKPFLLESNPDAAHPLSRMALNERLKDKAYQGHRLLPERTVKIKQHQDNPRFAAMVESMDQSLGRVLESLKSLGLEDRTLVIFTSDNGGMSAANFGKPDRVIAPGQLHAAYSTSNLPLRGGKGWLYEGGLRVPLIVKWPGQALPGTTSDVPVISMDCYPSLLEMAGLPARPMQHRDGVSFAKLLKGGKTLDREAIYWHFPHYSNHGLQSPGGAVRAGDFKLIEYFENGTMQLFNLKNDPGELRDMAQNDPQTADRLKRLLHEWRGNAAAKMMDPNPDYKAARNSE
jgi:arylsulfatase A-like enzyme